MDQSQQELRRAAAKAFQESLAQLGQRLQAEDEANEISPSEIGPSEIGPSEISPSEIAPNEIASVVPTQQSASLPDRAAKEPTIDVKALEEAAADIEEYMRSRDCEHTAREES